MARIPLEDNYTDVLNKAQRGLKITDADLARRADVSEEDLAALKAGTFNEAVARRIARHLRLHPAALVQLAEKKWYPEQPLFRNGFTAFNTPYGDMTVNSYLVWDNRTGHAAAFDTGANAETMLDLIRVQGLSLHYVFLTHTHEDHIADLARITAETKAEVWVSALEEDIPAGAKTFTDTVNFHLGPLSIKTLPSPGHSPGGTTYYVTGLSHPLAIVGDSIFASSMGGSPDHYEAAIKNNWKYILALPNNTVLACGHGPITTVAQEKKNNPFFSRW